MRLALLPMTLLLGCQTAATRPAATPRADPSAAYEALLQRVVTEDGYVDWTDLQRDHAALDAYVAWLARPGALADAPDPAHATWLNAYNAWVLYGVLDVGVPDSVKDVPGWIPTPGSGFFLERTYDLGGRSVSLYVAEHSHIRGGFSDWRDHAALNCASGSCPALRSELYVASRLDAQLDEQTRRWADDPVRGWRHDGERFVFTPLLDWYGADLPPAEGGLCGLLAPYASGDRRALLEQGAADGCPHDFFDYDWRLNRPSLRRSLPPLP